MCYTNPKGHGTWYIPSLRRLLSRIEKTLSENPTIGQLSDSLSVSPTHLRRLFKATFETPLASYIRSRRLALSVDMLFNTELGIVDIAVYEKK